MKNIINIKDFIDISSLEADLLICSEIIKPSGNRYDIIFESHSLNSVVVKFLEHIKNTYNVSFDGYVKNLQAYIQSEDCSDLINISKVLKREIKPIAEYSFILFIDAGKTVLQFTDQQIEAKEGEMIIFKTDQFIREKSESSNRIALIGSVTSKIERDFNTKSNI